MVVYNNGPLSHISDGNSIHSIMTKGAGIGGAGRKNIKVISFGARVLKEFMKSM
jgi:hypothetical protein